MSELTSLAVTAFLVALLSRAAWHKGQAFAETTGFAIGYALVPSRLVPVILRALIGAETLAVTLLLLPGTRAAGALLAAGLFLGYGALMMAALLRGQRQIECGCGGPPQIVSPLTIARNGALAAFALAVAALPAATVGSAGAVLALTAGLVAWAIYAVAEKLASHLPHIQAGRAGGDFA